MRTVFMGTPEFSAVALKRLAKTHEVALVVTRPDAVRSRGKELEPSAVKRAAISVGLECVEAKRISPELTEHIRLLAPDIIVVAAFGCILPDELLSIEGVPCINIHASLLPRWRGAAPIQRAILAGDKTTGVSIMRVVHELDAGDYCAQATTEIGEKNCDELTAELADMGSELLLSSMDAIVDGRATWTPQDESLVSFAPKLEKSELFLDPDLSAEQNLRRVRAQGDTAPARTCISGRRLRVLDAKLYEGTRAPQQSALLVGKSSVVLGCADSGLELLSLRPDGKRDMPASAFAQGIDKNASWEKLT